MIIRKVYKLLKICHLISENTYYKRCGISIGKGCKLYHNNFDEGHGYLLEIGDNCIITHTTILTHDASMKIYTGKTKVGIVKIGNNCFIGMNSIILPNVKIGENCIIGAGSVVTKSLEPNCVVAGNPATVIGKTDDFIKKHKEFMKKHPVFTTKWSKKSEDTKKNEKERLKDTFGYDE